MPSGSILRLSPQQAGSAPILLILSIPVKQGLKRDLAKYDDIRAKRSELGRKGGLKSGETRSKRKQKEAKAGKGEQRQAKANKSKQKQAKIRKLTQTEKPKN